MGDAMHGDRVKPGRAREPPRTGRRQTANCARDDRARLERAHRRVVGRLARGPSFAFVTPTDPRISRDVAIPSADLHAAREGDLVVAEITTYPTDGQGFQGGSFMCSGAPAIPRSIPTW
jgi:exoribonuclease R